MNNGLRDPNAPPPPTREQQHKMMITEMAHSLVQEASGTALTDPKVDLNQVVSRAFTLAKTFDSHVQAYMREPTIEKPPPGLVIR